MTTPRHLRQYRLQPQLPAGPSPTVPDIPALEPDPIADDPLRHVPKLNTIIDAYRRSIIADSPDPYTQSLNKRIAIAIERTRIIVNLHPRLTHHEHGVEAFAYCGHDFCRTEAKAYNRPAQYPCHYLITITQQLRKGFQP